MALIEAHLGLQLFGTVDVDAYASFNNLAKSIFCEILAKNGLIYDELSAEIWMPEETEYEAIFKGQNFDGYIAKHEYVLVSKLLKAPMKNRNILVEYLAKQPSSLFWSLSKKYKVDIKELLKNA